MGLNSETVFRWDAFFNKLGLILIGFIVLSIGAAVVKSGLGAGWIAILGGLGCWAIAGQIKVWVKVTNF